MNGTEQEKLKQEKALPEGGYKPNLEKLVTFAEKQDADGTLIPAFLAILEMCFQS